MKIKAIKTFICGAIYATAGTCVDVTSQVGSKLISIGLAEAVTETKQVPDAKPAPKKATR